MHSSHHFKIDYNFDLKEACVLLYKQNKKIPKEAHILLYK